MKFWKFWDRPKVEGVIANKGLEDWWLTTFTEYEREYIDNKFHPLGNPPHMLTQGKQGWIGPASDFLRGVKTYLNGKDDASIADRIERKIIDLDISERAEIAGTWDKQHYSAYVKKVKKFMKKGELESAERFLLDLLKYVEAQNNIEKLGVPLWYYEQLDLIYDKQEDLSKKDVILERCKNQPGLPRQGTGQPNKKSRYF